MASNAYPTYAQHPHAAAYQQQQQMYGSSNNGMMEQYPHQQQQHYDESSSSHHLGNGMGAGSDDGKPNTGGHTEGAGGQGADNGKDGNQHPQKFSRSKGVRGSMYSLGWR